EFRHSGASTAVPPLLVKTSFLWTASDSAYAAVNGDDLLPDLALGRLPAGSLEEAQTLVEKMVAFESSGLTLSQGPAVLVADNPDLAGDFEQSAQEVAPLLAPDHSVETIFLRELGGATRPTFAPSGLSLHGPADLFHKALIQQITSGRHERLGDAVLAAQDDFAQTGSFPELLSIYNLLGDPALRIR